MTIKAIETQYKGYRFRSRLEARWAVFFDALSVKWEYEKEGYILSDGTKYLPDFWIPKWKCFAEIKATKFTEHEYEKCKALPYPCLLLAGLPTIYNGYPVTNMCETYKNYIDGVDYDMWMKVLLSYSASKGRLWYLMGEDPYDYNLDIVPEDKAKSARFEFGDRK